MFPMMMFYVQIKNKKSSALIGSVFNAKYFMYQVRRKLAVITILSLLLIICSNAINNVHVANIKMLEFYDIDIKMIFKH
jgi:hypothetical protein